MLLFYAPPSRNLKWKKKLRFFSYCYRVWRARTYSIYRRENIKYTYALFVTIYRVMVDRNAVAASTARCHRTNPLTGFDVIKGTYISNNIRQGRRGGGYTRLKYTQVRKLPITSGFWTGRTLLYHHHVNSKHKLTRVQ